MAGYIPDKPVYYAEFDREITKLIGVADDFIAICRTARQLILNSLSSKAWYFWHNDIRRLSDSLALLEHDAFLFAEYTTRISKSVWDLYYKENPDITTDAPASNVGDWEEMRSHYFD